MHKLYKWPTVSSLYFKHYKFCIEFMFFSSQYQRRNIKTNARLYFSVFTPCTTLVPVNGLLWCICFKHSQKNDNWFMLANSEVWQQCLDNFVKTIFLFSFSTSQSHYGISSSFTWSDEENTDHSRQFRLDKYTRLSLQIG